MSTGKVDLTTDQTMQPMLGDTEVVAKQIDITELGAAADVDHGAGQWCLPILRCAASAIIDRWRKHDSLARGVFLS